MDKSRIAYLDLIRITACVLVVMVHVLAQQLERLPVDSVQYAIANAFNCLAFSGVALFVMISGALALNPRRDMPLKTLLFHKTVHFFLLYYLWKAIYQIVAMLENGQRFTLYNMKKHILLALIQERGYYHLWFLPMIAIVYMAVPLIKKDVAAKNVCRYFLCVFFITALLFPTLFHYEFKFKYLFVDFFASNDFYLFGGYLGYFVLGHYLHNWGAGFSPRNRKLLYIAGLCVFAAACISGTSASRAAGQPSYIMNTPMGAATFFTAMAIFAAEQSAGRTLLQSEQIQHVLQSGADTTLGIYLLHPLAITLFAKIKFDASICSPILSIPLLSACIVLVCGLAAAILSRIPIIRKLVR